MDAHNANQFTVSTTIETNEKDKTGINNAKKSGKNQKYY